jgi:hypothetical protein
MPRFAVGRVAVADGDQPLASRHGRRPEQYGIYQREDHGVGADAKCQSHDDGGRKPAMGEDHAQREAKIVGHRWSIRMRVMCCSVTCLSANENCKASILCVDAPICREKARPATGGFVVTDRHDLG